MPGTWTIYWPYFSPLATGESIPVPFTIAGIGSAPDANWAMEARDFAAATLPTFVEGQGFRQSIVVEKDLGWDGQGRKHFAAVIRFGPGATSEPPEVAVQASRAPDETFATLVGARMYGAPGRTQVAKQITRFPTGNVLPDSGLVIETADGVGCDVLEVNGDLTLEKRLPLSAVPTYLRDVVEPLISPRPRMNSTTFWGRPQGSLLFVDYDLSVNGEEGVIRGHFQFKPNLSNETVAGIAGVTANGHDHLEAYYVKVPEPVTIAGEPMTKGTNLLVGFYVCRIYDFGDFATLKMAEPS